MLKWLLRLTARRDRVRLMWRNSCILINPVTAALRRKDLVGGVNLSHFASGPRRTPLIGQSIWVRELHVGCGEDETWEDGLAGCSATQVSPVMVAPSHGWQGPHIHPENSAAHTVHDIIGCPDARWGEINTENQSYCSVLISPLCTSPGEFTLMCR